MSFQPWSPNWLCKRNREKILFNSKSNQDWKAISNKSLRLVFHSIVPSKLSLFLERWFQNDCERYQNVEYDLSLKPKYKNYRTFSKVWKTGPTKLRTMGTAEPRLSFIYLVPNWKSDASDKYFQIHLKATRVEIAKKFRNFQLKNKRWIGFYKVIISMRNIRF